MSEYIIGIDLGTTYSCVGVFKDGKIEIIANSFGNRTTPSYVAFTDKERLLGETAKKQMGQNSVNTIFDAKRLIGRKFSDLIVQQDIKNLPYKVISSDTDKPLFEVNYLSEIKHFSAEEISAMILEGLKKIAEDYLGTKVSKTVITVPAYFNDAQRHATKDAGRIAGLEVISIINEPTAAALAYGVDHLEGKQGKKYILVYDLGGGTFDVSLLRVNDGVYEVMATAGNTHLGGEDFDSNLVNYCLKNIKGVVTSKSLRRLRTACENAKRQLSQKYSVVVSVDNFNGSDLNITISRSLFDELNSSLFLETLKEVEKVFADSGIKKEEIGEIILVGGSTRIPKIQELLKIYFGKELNKTVNPDEAVAYGAIVQAGILTGNVKFDNLTLLDVAPLSLGLETTGGIMTILIPRNTKKPFKKEQLFSTNTDGQTILTIKIYEGEREFVKDCSLLGKFELKGIYATQKGIPKIMITFEINVDGILKVTAVDESSGNQSNITINNENERLSEERIREILDESEYYGKRDGEERARIESRNKLEQFLSCIKIAIENVKPQFINDEYDRLKNIVREKINWLEDNQNASYKDFTDCYQVVEIINNPIMLRIMNK